MNKLIKYISFLLIVISSVYITKEVINFKKDIILLEGHQASAVVKKERMLNPSVMITMINMPSLEDMMFFQSLGEDISIEEHIFNSLEVSSSSATGFSISYDAASNNSLLVTNDHFCQEYKEDSVLTIDKSSSDRLTSDPLSLDGEVILTDPSRDLCLIVANGYVRPVEIADYNYHPTSFEKVYIVGAPNGNFPIIIDTYISGFIKRDKIDLGSLSDDGSNFIILSEQIIHGHSGSAVFSEKGDVIGIVFATMGAYGGLAISHRDLISLLEEYSR
tara:strand:+ start:504 stop:1328 length:825 start_codon:yes stop_codon:yes gene_type:complete